MLFEQIYGRGDGRLYTDDQMKRMREARWGADTPGPRDLFSEDYTEKFNTELTADEEAQFQTWAKEQGREKDTYDYDLRGAWKELQSGDMGEDARGHLGDKYKKPNHPTFSAESIYSGQDGVEGGVWSRNAEGKDVYTPGRKLSSVEADRLKRYFARTEPEAVLDLTDRQLEERALPGVTQPLGFFDGMGSSWKGVPASVLQAASSAITLGKNSLAEVLASVGNDETRRWWRSQQAIMDINARDIRAYNKAHFDADPEAMGTATQIVHGLFKVLPKAVAYSTGLGMAGGALAFGADVGIDETNRLMDEGVDRNTAINAGMTSFALNAIGMRLPPVLGATRTTSTLYGAGVNVGTNIAETEGIKFILQHENYDELAKQYDLDAANLFVSATMGAAFGAAFWRSPAQIRADKYRAEGQKLYEDYRTKLFNKGSGPFTFQEAGAQAELNARAVVSFAQTHGIDPDKVGELAPKIVWTDGGRVASSGGEFNMPVTQGREWHMGPTKAAPDAQVTVVQYKGQAADRQAAMAQAGALASKGLKNEETGFVLTASDADLKKSLGGKFSYDERLFRAVAPVLDEVVAKARLMESSADVKHKNPEVQGVHIFATPVEIDGKLYRVQMVVRDYVTPKQERLATHKIAGIQIYEIENPPVSKADGGPSDIRGVTAPDIRLSSSPVAPSDHAISLAQLAGGRKPYVRQDGKGLFDSVDDSARANGGAYYEAQEFQQIIGLEGARQTDRAVLVDGTGEFYQIAYHGSPHVFSKFTLDHIGTGEGMQAHGWGLYFALNQETARGYQRQLSHRVFLPDEFERYADCKKRKAELDAELESLNSDMEQVRADAAKNPEEAAELPENEKFFKEETERLQAELKEVDAQIAEFERTGGRLYTVDIPEDGVLLREEATFDHQPLAVRVALNKLLGNKLQETSLGELSAQTRKELLDDIDGLEVYDKGAQDRILDWITNSEKDFEDTEFASRVLTREEAEARLGEILQGGQKTVSEAVKELVGEAVDAEAGKRIAAKYSGKDAASFFGNLAGRDIYRELVRQTGSDKAASLLLNENGIKGIRYHGNSDGECAVVWDEESIKTLEYLQRVLGEEGGIRGSFSPSENTIKLTPNANLSTFSHEHSHWYLTNLLAHAGDENLSAEAKGDIAAILHAFNLKSIDEWNALSFEEQARRQEQYAAWTELYLAEGKIPDTCPKYLAGFFKRFGEWLMNMYRDLLGDGAGDNAAAQEVGARYKAQFGEDLPAISTEVRKVLDRMYGVEKKAMNFRPKGPMRVAARVIQAQRANNDKITAPLQNGGAPDAYTAAIRAQKAAATAMNTGEKVDVSQAMRGVPVNDQAIQQAQNSFARAFQMGDTGTIVVLQNRDRTGAVSVGQMNAIATAPDYTRLSVSRTTDSGAPIVSFGSLPDVQHQGRTEIVADSNGDKIPMTYAVVEADSVLRSNNFDGTPVAAYGADPSRVHAVAGNGRMAGLAEAYNRGTAEQYRQDLMADAQSVGVDPAAVQGMQKPVLVRFMPAEKVTTGFIERSNSSNVMEKSALETAVQDSPRVRGNVWKYQFDEDGNPTPETMAQFLADIGEPNALGKLITADGRPTETALNRIRAAVFYEAYRDRTLTALVADDSDKQGIKRILTAMAAFAPHVINIREASNGAVDLGPVLVDVVNRIKNAKTEGLPLENILGQGDIFGDNPAVQQVLGLFVENQNSAAGIARVLQPFAEALENRLKSSGNGPQGGLFGEAENVTTDMADAMGLLREAQNRVIEDANAALREKGVTEGLREALPDVDVNAVRGTLQALAEAEKPAEKLAAAVVETVAPEVAPVREAAPEAPADVPPDATLETEAQAAAAHQAHERELFAGNPDRTQVESLAEVNPDQVYTWMDDDGQVQAMTAKELLESDAEIDAQAETDMAGMATAAMCIIRNQGITE